MITVFDLDDTLYDESSYVRSGLAAVARWGAERFGQDAGESLAEMLALLERNGRGRVFDDWLRGRAPVREAVKVYRHHDPDIALPALSDEVLRKLADTPLYLVTDGHKIVQAKKVAALGIADRFRHCYLTNRYGRESNKPSLRCFELILKRERADWNQLVYIGDNPAKDFVALNQVGACTVRVLTGRHADDAAAPTHEAQHRIRTLAELPLTWQVSG
jgi:putative hydrolase of the HAD superfamily